MNKQTINININQSSQQIYKTKTKSNNNIGSNTLKQEQNKAHLAHRKCRKKQ